MNKTCIFLRILTLCALILCGGIFCACTPGGKLQGDNLGTSEVPVQSSSEAPSSASEETLPSEDEAESAIPVEPDTESGRLAAWKQYLELLNSEKEKILAWNSEGAVAFVDITGNATPELIYLTAEEKNGELLPGKLHIVSAKDGMLQILFESEGSAFPAEDGRFCLFTTKNNRTLYCYTREQKSGDRIMWDYFEEQPDGTLLRTQLCSVFSEIDAFDASAPRSFHYLQKSCSEADYRSLTDTLQLTAKNVLFKAPDAVIAEDLTVFPEELVNCEFTLQDAIQYLSDTIANAAPETGSFTEQLKQFVQLRQYLKSGEHFETGDGSDEILFGLHDFDRDGQPELLITNGSPNFSEKTDYVYRRNEDSFSCIGEVGFRECVLFTAPDSAYPGVFCMAGHSGLTTAVYYAPGEDGRILPEVVATHEDTTYKVESHNDTVVTKDQGLYQTFLAACPQEGREAVLVEMLPEAAFISSLQ